MLVIFLCIFLAISFNQVSLGLSYEYLTREQAVMKSYKEFISGIYWQSLIVQLVCYYLLFSQYAFTPSFFVLVALTSVLVIISISDYYSLTVPNEASYGLIIPSILISYYIFDRTLPDLFLGGFLGFAILCIPRYLFLKFRKVEALGIGDLKLIISLGFLTGLSDLYTFLCVAIFSALAYALFSKKAIPFAPFLCLGTFISIILSA